jgi:hypothetical protein
VVVTTAESRARIAEDLAASAERLAVGAANLGDAYERLDQATADRLEEQLYAPVQRASGRARRAHGEFCKRFGLEPREIAPAPAAAGGHSPKALIDSAVAAVGDASHVLAALQDSGHPVEAGDAELRSAIIEVRELIAGVPGRARELERSLGR